MSHLTIWLLLLVVVLSNVSSLRSVVRMAAQQPFSWRDSKLFLRSGSETDFKGVLFDIPEKWPSFVDEDPDLIDSNEHFTLPMLPEGTVAFPGSRHFLFINEMKFREMFSEMAKGNDNRLCRCFVNRDGGVEPVALMCDILESRLLKSGMSMYVIQATKKVRIDKLIQRPNSSYLTGYIRDVDVKDEDWKAEILSNESSCVEIYNNLKVYLRLTKIHAKMISTLMKIDDKETSNLCLSPAIVRSRPDTTGKLNLGESEEDMHERQETFTCAVANLIQSTPSSMQKILEETTNARLSSLKKLIDMASGQMKNELLMVDSYKDENKEKIQEVMTKSFSPTDTADDLMPPEGFAELSLSQIQLDDGELLDDLVESELLGNESGGQVDDGDDPWSSDYILG